MFKWQWKRRKDPCGTHPWQQAMSIPLLSLLSATEQQQLIKLATRFLQQKQLVALQNLELPPLQQARIALIFCLPVLNLGYKWLDGFHEVLIYPAPFLVDEEWQDDFGLLHHERTVQSGQSWLQGPVVLNWADVQNSFDLSGYNLIIHEVAHKLDCRGSGYATGIPLIPLRDVAGWEQDLHAAMQIIQDEIDTVGEHATSIDPYAATDAAECFAVFSEYFFSAPQFLIECFPSFYARLVLFYRQDPLSREASAKIGAQGIK